MSLKAMIASISLAPVLASPTVQAQTTYVQERTPSTPGAHLCTSSIPSSDSKVRPRATGFRNEGTSNVFVICAFDSPPGQKEVRPNESMDDPMFVDLLFSSIDGEPHSFVCTGVNSFPGLSNNVPMKYVPKTVTINPAEDDWPTVDAMWTFADFGGTMNIPTAGSFSITCLLPPQVSIQLGLMYSYEDITDR